MNKDLQPRLQGALSLAQRVQNTGLYGKQGAKNQIFECEKKIRPWAEVERPHP